MSSSSISKRVLLVVAVVGVLVFSMAAAAQQQTGELLIKTTDPTGAVIPGAKVTLSSPVLIQPVVGTTDSVGIFPARSLKPGTYKVTVEKTGFRTASLENVDVVLGRTFSLDIPMIVGMTSEVVEVSSGGVAIDTVKSESSDVLNNQTLLSTPGARDFSDFIRVLPNVNNESMAAGISVNGASGAENVFYVDGVNTSNMYGGENNQTVRTEIVQELQVKSGGYEAEFGGAQGGVVSVVTKSGSNEFHGQGYYYYSGSALTAGPRKTLRLDPNAPEPLPAQYIRYAEDSANRNEIGASLGGPIWKNKAWFFVNVNPTFYSIDRTVDTIDANNAVHNGVYRQNQLTRSGLLKLDFQPIQRVRFFGSYTQDTWRWKGGLPARDGTGAYEFEWSKDGYKYPSYTFNLGTNVTLTPKLLIDARYGYNGINTKQLLGPSGPTWRFGTSNSAIGYTSANNMYRPSGWYNQDPNSTAYATVEDMQKKLTWSATGSLSFNAAGQHNFKSGYTWDRWLWDTINAHPYDYVRLYFGRSWTTLDGVKRSSSCVGPNGTTYDPCGYVEYRSPFGDIAKVHTDHHAFFFQDAWTIGRRLTINPGIRFEKEEIPSFSSLPEYKAAAMKWGFGEKIAPRFGAAYDLFGTGKAKIMGYWGQYYDQMKIGMAEGSFGGFKWHSQYYLMNQAVANNWQTLGSGHPAAGFTTGCNGSLSGGSVTCPNTNPVTGNMTFLEDRDWRIPSFDTLDPEVKPMRSTDIGLGAEFEIRKNHIFSANYVRTNLDRTIEDVGVMTPAGEMYYITNPGFGYSVSKFTVQGLPATPKAKRTYNGLTLRLRRPMVNNFMADVSYTYSRLYGNYAGLASSDEDWGAGGRADPNVERYFDQWYLSYDAKGKKIDGPMNTDRPHQLKMSWNYQLPHNLPAIGGFFQALSGTPITRAVTFNSTEWYVNNRMSDGRTPVFTQTDIFISQVFKPFKDESKKIEVNCNITNLFNQAIATRKYRLMNRNTLDLPSGWTSNPVNSSQTNAFFSSGFDWQAALKASQATENTTLDPRFGMDQTFQAPIAVRFGIRFSF